ncbi:uracil-DNA glycosylase [Kocuria sp. WRN011]|uniref:Uracil-DNA glycosylase n=1 Tax=Kocuria carniphila TaxID=262208 RepID=A0ABV3V293_9MICC|nr:uracil-DNA glycosylase [Kocuria sp. WRN011]PBB09444.1 uracil-DNA glycosylase [Kocuria sp. WRN011]PZP37039.1 MAG: uracil-DNA glycosylase [Kocuria rhizophila]
MTDPRPLNEIMSDDWAQALQPVEPTIRNMGEFLRTEHAAGHRTFPSGENIFRAFQEPFSEVKVLIVGQDPYPTPGHAMGLSFSVQPHVRPIPRSLQNIYKELQSDLDVSPPEHGDLSSWSEQGVMLLNRALSVREGSPASHRGKGWETVTECAIKALAQRGTPLVGILWGRDARDTKQWLGGAPTVESVHPSPLSASRGFFGSRPFSRANALLEELGAQPVNWTIPA